MDLEIKPQITEGILVLRLEGELDTYNCGQLRSAIVENVDKGYNRIVVDMMAVEYIDSTGLGSLVGGLKRVSERGGSMRLVCENPQILKIFEITGLDRVFSIHRTEAEALKAALAAAG